MRADRKRSSLALLAGSIGIAYSVTLLAAASDQEAAPLPPPVVAEPKPQPPANHQCDVDLRKARQMKDVISNVLLRAEHKPRSEVQAFLKDVQSHYATGDDLLKAAAEHFKIDQKRLAALVEHWRHINCKHAAIPGYAVPDPVPDAGREATTGETLAQEAAPLPPQTVAEPKPQPPATPQCDVDLRKAGG